VPLAAYRKIISARRTRVYSELRQAGLSDSFAAVRFSLKDYFVERRCCACYAPCEGHAFPSVSDSACGLSMAYNVCGNNAAVFGAQNGAHGAAIKRPISRGGVRIPNRTKNR